MMSEADHRRFSTLMHRSDMDASDEVLAGAVAAALHDNGLQYTPANIVVQKKRTDYRIDRVLHLRTASPESTLGLVLRTMGLPDGRLVVYLVVFRIANREAASEECLHIELFRSEPVTDWQAQPDPVAALHQGVVAAGYLEHDRWPQVAAVAIGRLDQFLQP